MVQAKARDFDPEIEYKAIERTLLESGRGRWFLAEHGRRARRLDTLTLHEAVTKLQSSLREPPAILGQLRTEIEDLQTLLRETREALVARQMATPLQGPKPELAEPAEPVAPAPAPQSATPAATPAETSTGHILAVAETIHDLAWDLQSQEINVAACENIARQASQIYALSHRHAVESERISKLTDALDGALHRLDGLLETVVLEAQFDTFNPPPEDIDDDDAVANDTFQSIAERTSDHDQAS